MGKLSSTLRLGRPIDQLRKTFGGVWSYDRDRRVWIQNLDNKTRVVYRCAALAPRYDGDDDSFVLQYRWEDTGELVFGLTEFRCAT